MTDLLMKCIARIRSDARDFSVLTFDYQLQFGDNGEFADAVAELLRHLKEKGNTVVPKFPPVLSSVAKPLI